MIISLPEWRLFYPNTALGTTSSSAEISFPAVEFSRIGIFGVTWISEPDRRGQPQIPALSGTFCVHFPGVTVCQMTPESWPVPMDWNASFVPNTRSSNFSGVYKHALKSISKVTCRTGHEKHSLSIRFWVGPWPTGVPLDSRCIAFSLQCSILLSNCIGAVAINPLRANVPQTGWNSTPFVSNYWS